jgi:phosphotransferase system HPr (HPr) family protein
MNPKPALAPKGTPRLTEKIHITNKLGLHLRAAAKLAHLAGQFKCTIQIRRGWQTINAKSVLNIIALAVHNTAELEICAEGEDAEGAVKAVRNLIENKFGERE